MDLPLADRHDTVLPANDARVNDLLHAASHADGDAKAALLADAVRHAPNSVAVWCALVDTTNDVVTQYAYARVGYHRGLDALRAAGWGGTGLVRWAKDTNRPFLRCLVKLRAAAERLGETAEVTRITTFLHDLDPDWDEQFVSA